MRSSVSAAVAACKGAGTIIVSCSSHAGERIVLSGNSKHAQKGKDHRLLEVGDRSVGHRYADVVAGMVLHALHQKPVVGTPSGEQYASSAALLDGCRCLSCDVFSHCVHPVGQGTVFIVQERKEKSFKLFAAKGGMLSADRSAGLLQTAEQLFIWLS